MKLTYIVDGYSEISVPEADEYGFIRIRQRDVHVSVQVSQIDDLVSALRNQKMAHDEAMAAREDADRPETVEPGECGKFRQLGDRMFPGLALFPYPDQFDGFRDRCIEPLGHEGAHLDLGGAKWVGPRG